MLIFTLSSNHFSSALCIPRALLANLDVDSTDAFLCVLQLDPLSPLGCSLTLSAPLPHCYISTKHLRCEWVSKPASQAELSKRDSENSETVEGEEVMYYLMNFELKYFSCRNTSDKRIASCPGKLTPTILRFFFGKTFCSQGKV